MSDLTEYKKVQGARIALYDDMLSAPRLIDIPASEPLQFIESIAQEVYSKAQAMGGSIPYTVIREVSENFIHAQFIEPTVSVYDKGNTIRFTDQGPGIQEKENVQKPGFTSATQEMKQYIRGVGSGLPIVKEYMTVTGGSLVIEDNIKNGAVITISMQQDRKAKNPETTSNTLLQINTDVMVRDSSLLQTQNAVNKAPKRRLEERDIKVLSYLFEEGTCGPTDIAEYLDVSVATAHRILEALEEDGYIESTNNRKRMLTGLGYDMYQQIKG